MDISIQSEINEGIVKSIRQNLSLFNCIDNVYLFGSVLRKNKIPHDIDLLLVYSKCPEMLINDINKTRCVLEEICGLPIDFTVLSIEELNNTKFLERIDIYLKLK